jgi:hypothetical protein
MRATSIFLLSMLVLAGCASLPGPVATDSGIEGRVTIGPMCPVVQIGNPCPDKPYQATLTVLTSTSLHKVIQFQTDANGYFRVGLAPGTYILHPESPNVMPYAADIPFEVDAHLFTTLNVIYDSGIR